MFYFHMYSKWIHLPCPFKETSESLSFELTVNSATRGQHTIMTTQLETVIGWLCVAIDTRLHEADLSVMRLKDTEGSVELEDGRRIPITSWKEFYTHTHTGSTRRCGRFPKWKPLLFKLFLLHTATCRFISRVMMDRQQRWLENSCCVVLQTAAADVWGSYSHMLELFLIIFFVV